MNLIYHCILKYDDILIFGMFHIKMSCIFVFIANTESVISLYFLSQIFKAVKEFPKLCFLVSTNRTNLHLMFAGHQLRNNICQFL